jgi:WD40 repeat protein
LLVKFKIRILKSIDLLALIKQRTDYMCTTKKTLFIITLFFSPLLFASLAPNRESLAEKTALKVCQNLASKSPCELLKIYMALPVDLKPALAHSLLTIYPELVPLLHTIFDPYTHLEYVTHINNNFAPGTVTFCTVSDCGTYAASITDTGSLTIIALEPIFSVLKKIDYNSTLSHLSFSPTGKFLAVAKADRVHIISIDSLEEVAQVKCYNKVTATTFNAHNDTIIYVGSKDRFLKSYCLETNKTTRIGQHPDQISALTFHKKLNVLISGCISGVVNIWNPENNCKYASVQAKGLIQYISHNTTDKHFFIHTTKREIQRLTWPEFDNTDTLSRKFHLYNVASGNLGYTVAFENKKVTLWFTPTSQPFEEMLFDFNIREVNVSSNGTFFTIIDDNDTVHVFKLAVDTIDCLATLMALLYLHRTSTPPLSYSASTDPSLYKLLEYSNPLWSDKIKNYFKIEAKLL